MLSELVHRTDIRMIQSRSRSRLPLEPLPHLPILRQLFRQKLQCYLPLEHLQVLGFKHFSHAAFPQKAHDLESGGYDFARGKPPGAVRVMMYVLEDRLAEKAARLLVTPSQLLDLLAQILSWARAR